MTQPPSSVPLLGKRLGVPGRNFQLPVDTVDELLLVCDLLLCQVSLGNLS